MKVLVLFSIEKKEPHLQWAVAKKRFLFENRNVNDNNVIRNVLSDKRLVKSVVLFFSSLHENLSPC